MNILCVQWHRKEKNNNRAIPDDDSLFTTLYMTSNKICDKLSSGTIYFFLTRKK